MAEPSFLGVVIVSWNHGRTLAQTVDSLLAQTRPASQVIIVDNGSADTSWAKHWSARPEVTVILENQNLGFTGGNNLGWQRLAPKDGFVLFLNPDVLLPPDLLSQLLVLMDEPRARSFGAVGVRLLGYDFEENRPTGRIDSTGIFPHWQGAWRDRRDGSPPPGDVLEAVPALCGAFLFCRVAALRAIQFPDETVFDNRYFTYKEDIELSLRLRGGGWNLGVWHGAEAWHGRGWNQDRAKVPRVSRLLSARNEVRLHARYAPWRLPYSLAKWAYVHWWER
ncbi:MAG TPA: glycosyltransferase family 2 protein [Opitutaceae bacterium]|jgi:N-acetylglucosaminyl-diphospho-decaprenol L-rhamnosyltransferase|nr:glycosyltransferase family 2 protein [Opitutaceae bacterium]